MEFYENGGAAIAKLLWSSPSTPKAVIPRSQLYSSSPTRRPSRSTSSRPPRPCPVGYLKDDGAAFANRGNGYSYGWNATNVETRDRNSANSPDQRYDTLIHLQKPSLPNAAWEIAVPNGTYSVRDRVWRPELFDSVYRIAVEGALTVNGTPTTSTPMDRRNAGRHRDRWADHDHELRRERRTTRSASWRSLPHRQNRQPLRLGALDRRTIDAGRHRWPDQCWAALFGSKRHRESRGAAYSSHALPLRS